jgi:ATP synthase protein I
MAKHEQDEREETGRKSGIAYAAAFTLFASVAAFCGIGWLVDRWLGTQPWFMVCGLVVGAAAGFYEFVRLTSKLSE